jgi:hypothetical protein
MSTNKILTASVIGGVVALVLGFLIYGVALQDFFAANMGSAKGVNRADGEMMWLPMIIGHLAWGGLFALIFGRWANISTLATGAKAGAVIGLLVSLAHNMITLGTTHIMNPTSAIVDVLIVALTSAIVGGVVGWFYGKDLVA